MHSRHAYSNRQPSEQRAAANTPLLGFKTLSSPSDDGQWATRRVAKKFSEELKWCERDYRYLERGRERQEHKQVLDWQPLMPRRSSLVRYHLDPLFEIVFAACLIVEDCVELVLFAWRWRRVEG